MPTALTLQTPPASARLSPRRTSACLRWSMHYLFPNSFNDLAIDLEFNCRRRPIAVRTGTCDGSRACGWCCAAAAARRGDHGSAALASRMQIQTMIKFCVSRPRLGRHTRARPSPDCHSSCVSRTCVSTITPMSSRLEAQLRNPSEAQGSTVALPQLQIETRGKTDPRHGRPSVRGELHLNCNGS